MTKAERSPLAGIEILANLSDRDLAELEKRCVFRHFKAHELIIDRQSDSREVYLIVRGKVRVVNYSLSGREVTFDDLVAGVYFGELAALDGLPRSANCVALEDVLVATLSQNPFHHLVSSHSQVAFRIMAHLAQVIRTATARTMDLSTRGANNRASAELLRPAKRSEGRGEG